jgi:hypothetical protein
LLDDATLSGTGGGVFVARLDPSGSPRWAARLDGPYYLGIAVDAGGSALVACARSARAPSVTVAKLDASGNALWQKDVLQMVARSDGYESVTAAAGDSAGGLLLTGALQGTMQVGSAMLRAVGTATFTARIDESGNPDWGIAVGPGADMNPIEMALDSAGNAIIGEASTTGGPIRLARVTTHGSVTWRAALHNRSTYAFLSSIAVDSRGNTLLCGRGDIVDLTPAEAQQGWWIAKLDPSGQPLWQMPGSGRLTADRADDVFYVTDRSATKLDPSGALVWKWAPVVTGGSRLGAIAVTPAGELLVAGYFQGSMDFGSGPVDSGSQSALFLAALAP